MPVFLKEVGAYQVWYVSAAEDAFVQAAQALRRRQRRGDKRKEDIQEEEAFGSPPSGTQAPRSC